jgi:hypothetical protein
LEKEQKKMNNFEKAIQRVITMIMGKKEGPRLIDLKKSSVKVKRRGKHK